MPKQINIIAIIIFFIFVLCSSSFSQNETITVTTFYPSPYGIYSILRLNPLTNLALPCQSGEMYFNQASARLFLCVSAQWKRLGLFLELPPPPPELWSGNIGGDIYYDAGNVGIGNRGSATEKLTVGQKYIYKRDVEPTSGSPTSASCDCDIDNTIFECGDEFGSFTDQGLTCDDAFEDTGISMYYGYTQQPFAGGIHLNVNGQSWFGGNVGISTAPSYPLQVNGGVRITGDVTSTSYISSSGTPGITQTITIDNGSGGTCNIDVENGLIYNSTCP